MRLGEINFSSKSYKYSFFLDNKSLKIVKSLLPFIKAVAIRNKRTKMNHNLIYLDILQLSRYIGLNMIHRLHSYLIISFPRQVISVPQEHDS